MIPRLRYNEKTGQWFVQRYNDVKDLEAEEIKLLEAEPEEDAVKWAQRQLESRLTVDEERDRQFRAAKETDAFLKSMADQKAKEKQLGKQDVPHLGGTRKLFQTMEELSDEERLFRATYGLEELAKVKPKGTRYKSKGFT